MLLQNMSKIGVLLITVAWLRCMYTAVKSRIIYTVVKLYKVLQCI